MKKSLRLRYLAWSRGYLKLKLTSITILMGLCQVRSTLCLRIYAGKDSSCLSQELLKECTIVNFRSHLRQLAKYMMSLANVEDRSMMNSL